MDSLHDERRKYTRITLRAYAFEQKCHFFKEGKSFEASLVDISPGGARVRPAATIAELGIARGDTVVLCTGITCVGQLLDGMSGEVRWAGDIDFGMQFTKELTLAASDLQRILAV